MRAVVTVIGRDAVGIIAELSGVMRDNEVNILDISQSVLQDMFAMVMLVDVTRCICDFSVLAERLSSAGERMAVKVITMHEDIFNSMHRI